MTHPIPEHIGSQLERADWEPKEALQFYADGNHFDVVDGKTRILDTGGIASNALKSLSIDRLELKGDAELHELREKVIAQQARITELETTPPDKREDLRCVISDLCHQVRERDEKIVAQQARIEQLRSLLFNAHGVFDDGEDIGNYRLIVSFGVADTLCDQIEEALEFQDDLSALRAHDAELIEKCAVTAWTHYADTCKSKGANPHHFGEWIASDKIRNLAEAIEKGSVK